MDSQSIITQANRDESCTEFPILSLPRPVPPAQNAQGLRLMIDILASVHVDGFCWGNVAKLVINSLVT